MLVVLHLAGCAADFATEQTWLMSAFCMAGESGLAEGLATGLWSLLALSWAVGLLAVRWPAARPFYWGLLVAMPPAWIAQQSLLARGLFSCDGP